MASAIARRPRAWRSGPKAAAGVLPLSPILIRARVGQEGQVARRASIARPSESKELGKKCAVAAKKRAARRVREERAASRRGSGGAAFFASAAEDSPERRPVQFSGAVSQRQLASSVPPRQAATHTQTHTRACARHTGLVTSRVSTSAPGLRPCAPRRPRVARHNSPAPRGALYTHRRRAPSVGRCSCGLRRPSPRRPPRFGARQWRRWRRRPTLGGSRSSRSTAGTTTTTTTTITCSQPRASS